MKPFDPNDYDLCQKEEKTEKTSFFTGLFPLNRDTFYTWYFNFGVYIDMTLLAIIIWYILVRG